MFQTLISALGAFVGLGVSGAAGVKYYDGDLAEGELKSYIAVCIEILGVTVGVIFGFMFMFREHLSGWIGLPTKWILWAVLMSSASVVFQIRQIQWQVRKAARNYGVFQVAQSLFNMLLSLLFVVILLQGAEGRMAAQILAMGVFALLALVLLKRDDLLGGFVWQPSLVKEALRFGVPLIPHTAGGFLLTSVDRFVINAELGLVEAGVYMVAVQLTSAMTLIFDAINKAYVPWLFERLKRDHDAEKRQIVRYTYVWFAIILLGTGLAFVIGPWLVTLIAGEEYARAGDVIGWLALGQAFGGMYLMVTNYIFYSKRTGLL